MRRKYLSNRMRCNDRRQLQAIGLGCSLGRKQVLPTPLSSVPLLLDPLQSGTLQFPTKKISDAYLLRRFFFVRWNMLETGASAIFSPTEIDFPDCNTEKGCRHRAHLSSPISDATEEKKRLICIFPFSKRYWQLLFLFFSRAILRGIERYDKAA